MRSIYVYIVLLFFACSEEKRADKSLADEKYFHGEVTYSYSYESTTLDVDSLIKVRPHTGKMLFEGENYQSEFIGADTSFYIYIGSLNACYGYYSSTQSKECEDYSTYTDSIITYKIYDSDTIIQGSDCFVLEFQSKYFWNRYYVSNNIHLDPRSYENHHAYNWSFYGIETNGGLILGMEHRFKDFVMKGSAISIDQYEKDDKHINLAKALSHCTTN